MSTPSFKFVQDEKFLIIKIRTPEARVTQMKASLEEDSFLFTCPPYYLRLKTPGEIVDDGRALYNYHYPSFVIKYPKCNTGEHFENLEFPNKFLVPVEGAGTNEVLESTYENVKFVDNDDLEFTPEFDINTGYGFAFRYKIDSNKINILFSDIFEVDPQDARLYDRRILRLETERHQFDKEHYLANFFDDGHINEILAQKCPYKPLPKERLEDEEVEILMKLPNVHIQMCDQSLKVCHYALLEILFAYCFDLRCNFFSGSCESVWTMNKLAATLCWHEAYQRPREVFTSVFRRAMIYPLHRHFQLCQTVFEDLKVLLQLDTLHIVRALIKIYHIFMEDDRYILNNMFIKPYMAYIQKWDDDVWRAVVKEVLEIQIKKSDLGLRLEDLEKGVSCPVVNTVAGDSDDSDY